MFGKLKLQWIEGARYWHKLWSIRMALLSAGFGVVSASLPTWQPAIPPLPFAILSTACALIGAVSRLVQQPTFNADVAAGKGDGDDSST